MQNVVHSERESRLSKVSCPQGCVRLGENHSAMQAHVPAHQLFRQIMSSTSQRASFFISLFAVAFTFLIAGAGVSAFYVSQKKADDASQPAVPNAAPRPTVMAAVLVRVEPARLELIHTIREFHGRLYEVQRAEVSTEVAGLVKELPIEVGQRVKGGETLIAQIDKTWIELMVEQTEVEVANLTKQLEAQQTETERIFHLHQQRVESDSALLTQKTLLEEYKQNLAKAVIANKEAKEKLKRTTILAPFDGYIIKRDTGVGELLAPGTPIAEIVSEGFVDAGVNVVEDYINQIKIGDEMPIVIDRLGIKRVGKVHSIIPYDGAGTRSFPVLVRLDDNGGELKVGMAATALVSTTAPREEIVVSKDAVLDSPEGAVVWVVVPQTAENDDSEQSEVRYIAKSVPVKITAKAIEDYGVEPETEEGRVLLVAGAQTVIEGIERLVPDQVVRIVEMDPAILENLPPASGQKSIAPKERIGY